MEIMRTAAQTLQQLCGSDLEKLAASTGVIKRKRKFSAVSLLRMLVFTALKHRVPRPADFKRTALQFGVDVSKAAIPARFTDELVTFLRAVLDRALERLLTAKPATLVALQGFTAIYLGDGTTAALPDNYAAQFPGCGGTAGSGGAALKIQLLWEVLSGAVRRLVIESGTSSDALSPIAQEPVPAGSLMVFDLGYFGPRPLPPPDRRRCLLGLAAAVRCDGVRQRGPGTAPAGLPATPLRHGPTAHRYHNRPGH